MIYNVTTMHGSKIMIGQRGENLATTIEIDVSEWLAKWPGSTFNVLVRRPGDIIPYVTSTSLSGNILRWPVTSTDTANAGLGKIEVRATLNGVIKKSAIATIGIAPCILCLENEQPPELDPAVADVALEAAVRAENAVLAAETARWHNARNLLNNSSFRKSHVIALAGFNSSHGSNKYVCDRWISWSADATFSEKYMTVGSPIDQRLDPTLIDMNAKYTVAIGLADGTVNVDNGTFSSGIGSYALGIIAASGNGQPYVRLNTGFNICWAALYEGAYTADTLPAYQYKGYAAELAECQRYYRRSITGMFVGVAANNAQYNTVNFSPMRIAPTVTTTALNGNDVEIISTHIDGFRMLNNNVNNAQITWEASADL